MEVYEDGSRIVFGGDSHDASWDHILENHEADVTNVDLLIAPHHGRCSNACPEEANWRLLSGGNH